MSRKLTKIKIMKKQNIIGFIGLVGIAITLFSSCEKNNNFNTISNDNVTKTIRTTEELSNITKIDIVNLADKDYVEAYWYNLNKLIAPLNAKIKSGEINDGYLLELEKRASEADYYANVAEQLRIYEILALMSYTEKELTKISYGNETFLSADLQYNELDLSYINMINNIMKDYPEFNNLTNELKDEVCIELIYLNILKNNTILKKSFDYDYWNQIADAMYLFKISKWTDIDKLCAGCTFGNYRDFCIVKRLIDKQFEDKE